MPNETRKPVPLTLELVAQQAKEQTLRFGSHSPTLIAEGTLQTWFAQIEHLADTHEQRLAQMFVHGVLLAQTGEIGVLQQVFFISEAWLSTAKRGEQDFVPPSKHPQRKEVLIIARHVTTPPKDDGVIFEMRRNSRGRLARLDPFEFGQESEKPTFQSPLMDAFLSGFLGKSPSTDEKVQ